MPRRVVHRMYRRAWLSGVAMLALTALLAGYARPASASAGGMDRLRPSGLLAAPADVLADGLGDLRIEDSGDDVIFAFDFTIAYDRNQLNSFIAEIQQAGTSLSETVRTQLQAYRVSVPYSGTENWRAFDGTLSATDTGLQIVVRRGEVRTNASWWVQVAATVLGVAVGLAIRVACVGGLLAVNPGAGPTIGVICVALGTFLGSMTRSLILMAADGKTADSREWAKALALSFILAVGGVAWENGLNTWAKETLPGMMKNFGNAVKALAARMAGWWGGFRASLTSVGDKIGEMGEYLRGLLSRPAPTNLRVLPLGDSITAGVGGTSGNGYRGPMFATLDPLGGNLDLVGGQRDGSMPDPDHEGHPGWRIDDIGAITAGSLERYRPNVVTLLAGTNDLGQDDAGAPARLAALIDRILASDPEVHVLVATVPTSRDGARQARHAAYNNAVINLVGQTARVGVVDTGNITLADMADPLHPNDNGYDKLGRDFAAGVYALLIQDVLREPRPLPGGDGPGGCTDQNTWYPQGILGNGAGGRQHEVRFADINGDGRDDYLHLHEDGSVDAWVNGGGQPNNWIWHDYGRIAHGVGAAGRNIMFGDINGDGRDDYLVVGEQGQVNLWLNGGGQQNDWHWNDMGKIADGVGKKVLEPLFSPDPNALIPIQEYALSFADLNGDNRDDYIVSTIDSGQAEAWLVGGDPFHPTLLPQGVIAWGAGPGGTIPRFGNVDCAGRADYLRVDRDSGAVTAYRNNGPAPGGGISWSEMPDFASGDLGNSLNVVMFADLNGDSRDDYIVVNPDAAPVNVYLRG